MVAETVCVLSRSRGKSMRFTMDKVLSKYVLHFWKGFVFWVYRVYVQRVCTLCIRIEEQKSTGYVSQQKSWKCYVNTFGPPAICHPPSAWPGGGLSHAHSPPLHAPPLHTNRVPLSVRKFLRNFSYYPLFCKLIQ